MNQEVSVIFKFIPDRQDTQYGLIMPGFMHFSEVTIILEYALQMEIIAMSNS